MVYAVSHNMDVPGGMKGGRGGMQVVRCHAPFKPMGRYVVVLFISRCMSPVLRCISTIGVLLLD